MTTDELRKYPRTPHISGSRIQPGDEDLSQVPFDDLLGKHVVLEEKIDGANCAMRFDSGGRLLLQSRGHYLTGGGRERQFDRFKQWASCLSGALWQAAGTRYVVYGEWTYAKHCLFYDCLPHYFHEFDVLDLETDTFLDTERRHRLLAGLPIVHVPVIHAGALTSRGQLDGFIGPARYISPQQRQRFEDACRRLGYDVADRARETDLSGLMEGLYIKVEEDGRVRERYKYIRPGFSQAVMGSGEHWEKQPPLPNRLADGAHLF